MFVSALKNERIQPRGHTYGGTRQTRAVDMRVGDGLSMVCAAGKKTADQKEETWTLIKSGLSSRTRAVDERNGAGWSIARGVYQGAN